MDESVSQPPAVAASRKSSVAVHAGFIATGMVTTLLGPILPLLASRWALSDVQAGSLFFVQFAGATAASILVGTFLPRRGFRFSLTLGFVLMCLGVGVLGYGSWRTALLALFCAGAGQGVAITTSNLFIAEINAGRTAAALNFLNLSWSLGAILWPLTVALAIRVERMEAALLALSAALGIIVLWMARLPLDDLVSPRSFSSAPQDSQAHRLEAGAFALFGAMFFLYVGVEGSVGGWVAADMQRITPANAQSWVFLPSNFCGALLLGRALGPGLLRRLQEQTLLHFELLLATFGLTLLLVSKSSVAVLAGATLSGLGLACVFPIFISLLKRRLGASSSRFAGLHFALGGIGGATLPWLVGNVSTAFGSLKAGLLVPLFAWLCLMALDGIRARSFPAGAETGFAPPAQ